MFSHHFYNVVHIVGIAMLAVALGALALHGANGGARDTNRARGLVAALHGLGALLVLLGGFGMLARLEHPQGSGFPGWIWGKLLIWLLLGAALVVPRRGPAASRALLVAVPLLAGVAAWLAIYKPI
jgi:hypothetical protein